MQGDHISFNKQLVNHALIVSRIKTMMGIRAGRDYLGKCLYTVGFGSNDYINNYFLPQFYPTSRIYTPDQYADLLIQLYSVQLKVSFFRLFFFTYTPAIFLILFWVENFDFVRVWSKENSSVRAWFLRLHSCRNGHV